MIIIFGTTNERKTEDLRNIVKELGLNIEIKSLKDISWDRGDIEETGSTLEELLKESISLSNSLYNKNSNMKM